MKYPWRNMFKGYRSHIRWQRALDKWRKNNREVIGRLG